MHHFQHYKIFIGESVPWSFSQLTAYECQHNKFINASCSSIYRYKPLYKPSFSLHEEAWSWQNMQCEKKVLRKQN